MQIILTKEEYDELVNKATNTNKRVEEELEEWKGRVSESIKQEFNELVKRHRGGFGAYAFSSTNPLLTDLKAWLDKHL